MGGNGPLIVQIIGVLLILFFCFLVYMFTKTWRWHHVTLALFLFAATVTFLTYASMTLKTHQAWKQIVNKQEAELEIELAAIEKLKFGDPADPLSAEDSIGAIKGQLVRAVLDRGRVWRGCTTMDLQRTFIQLSTVPPGTAAGEEKPNLLEEKDVLYAFSEAEGRDGFHPDMYLGEYKVSEATDRSIKIAPILPADQTQLAKINENGLRWVLYEVMPLDSHYAFRAISPDDDHLFGEIELDDGIDTKEAQVGTWYQNRYEVAAEVYSANIAEYLNDGKPLEPTDDYPPENVWVKVRFKKSFEIAVDSDETADIRQGDYFDINGRAIVGALRLPQESGGQVKFSPGDFAVFAETGEADQKTVKDLYDGPEAVCDPLGRVFVRPLNDYHFIYHHIAAREKEIAYDSAIIERDNTDLANAKAKMEKDIDYRTAERGKLQDDLAQFTVEKDTAGAYRDALQNKWNGTRQRINELYRMNKLLSQQLTDAHHRLKVEIDRRTAAATASARP